MNKVYVVTSGSDDDFGGVDAIFTDRDLAQKYIDSFGEMHNDFNYIEECEINPFEFELNNGYKPYYVVIDKQGKIEECKISYSSSGFENENRRCGFYVTNDIYVHVFAKDENHAIKIANEKRVQLIAMNNKLSV